MDIEKIKKEFDDYDWFRGVFNKHTIDAIKWLVNRVNELEHKPPECAHELISAKGEFIQSGYLCVKCNKLFAEAI